MIKREYSIQSKTERIRMTIACSTPFALIALCILLSTVTSEAQSGNQACISNLVSCASFMGSTSKPPQSCCGPLKTAVTTQLDCLCRLFNTPGLLQSVNVNLTQALSLPSLCGIEGVSVSECSKVSDSAPSPVGTLAPTGTPGNGVGKITGYGISGLLSLIAMLLF